MEGREMALLAEEGRTGSHQPPVRGAVWRMAAAAVLGYRCMFPQKRPAFFGMAIKALLIECEGCQFSRTGATVWCMTVSAGHLPGTQWMAGGLKNFRSLALMTVRALLIDLLETEHRICKRMQSMTTGTTQIGKFMRAAYPVMAGLVFMTA
ncbi:MAG: hypothetical protein WD396_02555 [Pseudohongiellaceae bacterium]